MCIQFVLLYLWRYRRWWSWGKYGVLMESSGKALNLNLWQRWLIYDSFEAGWSWCTTIQYQYIYTNNGNTITQHSSIIKAKSRCIERQIWARSTPISMHVRYQSHQTIPCQWYHISRIHTKYMATLHQHTKRTQPSSVPDEISEGFRISIKWTRCL